MHNLKTLHFIAILAKNICTGGMFNTKNFQREIFCRSREIFVEVGSFDNYKAPIIMLWYQLMSPLGAFNERPP